MNAPRVRIEKRLVRCDKSKEEIIEETLRDTEDYFQELEKRLGKKATDKIRKQHRRGLEEDLRDYVQGEEIEIEVVVLE